ncbi:MAG: glycosyltransferase family 2 protein [Actinomycetales bacterium]|nr:glycosyltransferase family 2 protein [Actinomycetales bacterium]
MTDPFRRPGRCSLSVIMPAFNEAETVAEALAGLLAVDFAGRPLEVIVVESNSTDTTRDIVEGFRSDPRVHIIWEDRPRGKGHAVRTGLPHARHDVIAIHDADTEYESADLLRLLGPIEAGETSLVLGSRHTPGTPVRTFTDSWWRAPVMNVAHRFFTTLFNTLYGSRLRDPETMFKVFRREALADVRLRSDRFEFDYELLGTLLRRGCRPQELPVSYRSRDFTEGKKIRFFADPPRWAVAMIRFRFTPLAKPSERPWA